jgi:cytochrome c biogenesis protein CcdA/thiol-disulfide isomerase/thioredoxin
LRPGWGQTATVLVLLGIGFLGGLITGISPCILPVLPVIVAGSAAEGNRRRPFAIIAGLVVSFSLITLVGGSLLSLLHLPADLLRDLGIAILFLLALGLVVPPVGEWLERPFARLGARHQATSGGALLLGVSLGAVFVPCAGPVLAAVSAVAATHRVGFTSVLLTLAYAAGAALPLLGFALVAQRTATGWKRLRDHTPLVRRVAGVVLGLTALAITLNLTRPLQTSVPGYTTALQNRIEGTPSALRQLAALDGETAKPFAKGNMVSVGSLPNLGPAPAFTDIAGWLNTPGGRPLSLAALRGKVVLVDFWTYSCVNCARALPHVESWYSAYKDHGFVVVGVHTPEFGFEHVIANVRTAAAQLGVHYPVAIDNNYTTWDAYANQYWPAEYLIDQNGAVRHFQFGEGDYGGTEADIRLLLAASGAHLPVATEVADRTPTGPLTPESYLGYDKLANYTGSAVQNDRAAAYVIPPSLPADTLSFGGTWTVHHEEATAGARALIALHFHASNVYVVLGGRGTVGVSLNGGPVTTLAVGRVPDLYQVVSARYQTATVTLAPSAGVEAYSFTFG